MMTRYAPPPGPDRLARITTTPWVDRSSPAGPCCRLLLAHDPLRPGETLRDVEQDMLGLANGLGLGPAHHGRQYLGPVAYMRGGYTLLDYGHDELLLHVPDPGAAWRAAATASTHVHITLGLDPRPDDDGTDTRLFTRVAAETGRLWAGIASVRT